MSTQPRPMARRAAALPWLALAVAILAVPAALSVAPGTPYPSRAQCWLGQPVLIKVHDWGNAAIWVQYVMIPVLLLWTGWKARAWRIAQTFPGLMIAGCNFVFWCGVTHLLARTEVYRATPWVSAVAIVIAVAAGMHFLGDFLRRRHEIDRWLRAINVAAEAVDHVELHPEDPATGGLRLP